MTPTKPIIKYALYAIVGVAIVVGAVLVFKNNKTSQQAALYKTDALQSGALTTTATKFTDPGNLTPCIVGSTTPYVRVISPNGGETYSQGQQITVKWSTCNISSSSQMTIAIYNMTTSHGANLTIPMVPNTGSALVTLPTYSSWQSLNAEAMSLGQLYKIHVFQGGNNNSGDYSDNLFTINNQPNPMSGLIIERLNSNTASTQSSTQNTKDGVFDVLFKITNSNNYDVILPTDAGAWGAVYGANTQSSSWWYFVQTLAYHYKPMNPSSILPAGMVGVSPGESIIISIAASVRPTVSASYVYKIPQIPIIQNGVPYYYNYPTGQTPIQTGQLGL